MTNLGTGYVLAREPRRDESTADLLHNDVTTPTVPQYQELLSEIGNSSRVRQMDGYIRASGFVLCPCVFVAGPDCSRRTRLRGKP